MTITPKLTLLDEETPGRILDEAFQLLKTTGVKVQSKEARELLRAGGAPVDDSRDVVQLPEDLIRRALETVPRSFALYDRTGRPAVAYGGDDVHFDPGSSCVNILDPETLTQRPAQTADLIRIVKVTETLPQYAAQSTAVVCNEVPKAIGDLYRLYLVLLFSAKPIVTGAFSVKTTAAMFDLLAIEAGGMEAAVNRPRAIFDVCPTPPLIWSDFAAQNIMDLARAGLPAQIVSMPLAGAAAPVTLLGSLVQHAAECLSGITLHQMTRPGSPIVWGGAPAIFDMRQGTTPMGAIETAMLDAAYAQVGKSLGLPTHAYLGASDAKLVDAQAGLESGLTALIGALAGINMISGAGMLDFLACHSVEKLVIDAEAIGMINRLRAGITQHTPTLALELFTGIEFKADFLKQKATRRLFAQEQYLPSQVIDRGSGRAWTNAGQPDAFQRARQRVGELLTNYARPEPAPDRARALHYRVAALAREAGLEHLPDLESEFG